MFCAPHLIAHYVRVHHYAPPAEFVESVLACPVERIPRFEFGAGRSDAAFTENRRFATLSTERTCAMTDKLTPASLA